MNAPSARREAFFLEADRGQRFCLLTRPSGRVKGCILFLHPFAEEMNKSRRMVSTAVAAFAAGGWAVLLIDHFGCGDSSGDFRDANWNDWVADVTLGWQWLHREVVLPAGGGLPAVLWSLRAGSLVGADWMRLSGNRPPLLFWQPVTNGKQHLSQFLRLKAASEMLSAADPAAAMKTVREALLAGRSVEVAGYALSPGLAAGMDQARLEVPETGSAPLLMLELSAATEPVVSPALRVLLEKWLAQGMSAAAEPVTGPGFWQTQEIEIAPALIEPSLRFLEGLVR